MFADYRENRMLSSIFIFEESLFKFHFLKSPIITNCPGNEGEQTRFGICSGAPGIDLRPKVDKRGADKDKR